MSSGVCKWFVHVFVPLLVFCSPHAVCRPMWAIFMPRRMQYNGPKPQSFCARCATHGEHTHTVWKRETQPNRNPAKKRTPNQKKDTEGEKQKKRTYNNIGADLKICAICTMCEQTEETRERWAECETKKRPHGIRIFGNRIIANLWINNIDISSGNNVLFSHHSHIFCFFLWIVH